MATDSHSGPLLGIYRGEGVCPASVDAGAHCRDLTISQGCKFAKSYGLDHNWPNQPGVRLTSGVSLQVARNQEYRTPVRSGNG